MNYIKELRDGEMVSEIYLCKNKVVAKTKAGKTYYSLQLQDKTGTQRSGSFRMRLRISSRWTIFVLTHR